MQEIAFICVSLIEIPRNMKLFLIPLFLISLQANAQKSVEMIVADDAIVGAKPEIGARLSQSVEFPSLQSENDVWKKRRSWKFGLGFPFITDFHHEIQDYCVWHLRPVADVFVQHNRVGYLNRTPVNGRVRFGIDYGFCDVDYSCISYLECGDHKHYLDVLSYGVHIGPSANVRVADKFNLSIYAHVKPTFCAVFFENMFDYSFTAYCAGGAQLAWRSIGVGAECQWYPTTCSNLHEVYPVLKYKAVGPRFYVAYRF